TPLACRSATFSSFLSPQAAATRSYSLFFTPSASSASSPLSLHDALPICPRGDSQCRDRQRPAAQHQRVGRPRDHREQQHDLSDRSEEHTSELQSRENLVCRLLLEKKNKQTINRPTHHAQRGIDRWTQKDL